MLALVTAVLVAQPIHVDGQCKDIGSGQSGFVSITAQPGDLLVVNVGALVPATVADNQSDTFTLAAGPFMSNSDGAHFQTWTTLARGGLTNLTATLSAPRPAGSPFEIFVDQYGGATGINQSVFNTSTISVPFAYAGPIDVQHTTDHLLVFYWCNVSGVTWIDGGFDPSLNNCTGDISADAPAGVTGPLVIEASIAGGSTPFSVVVVEVTDAPLDAGVDAGTPDAGVPDAGQPGAGAADAGAPDAGLLLRNDRVACGCTSGPEISWLLLAVVTATRPVGRRRG